MKEGEARTQRMVFSYEGEQPLVGLVRLNSGDVLQPVTFQGLDFEPQWLRVSAQYIGPDVGGVPPTQLSQLGTAIFFACPPRAGACLEVQVTFEPPTEGLFLDGVVVVAGDPGVPVAVAPVAGIAERVGGVDPGGPSHVRITLARLNGLMTGARDGYGSGALADGEFIRAVQDMKALKQEALGQMPSVWDTPFRDWYRAFGELNRVLDLVSSHFLEDGSRLDGGIFTDEAWRGIVENYLGAAQETKQRLERMVPPR